MGERVPNLLGAALVVVAILGVSGFAGTTRGESSGTSPTAWSIGRDFDGTALVDLGLDRCAPASRMAPDGRFRFVYVEASRLFYGAEGGGPPVPITGPTVLCQDTDLAFKPDGTAVVGWLDLRNQGVDWWNTDAFVATEDTGWRESLVTGATDGRVEALRIEVDPAGAVHALYRRFTLPTWPYNDYLFAASSPTWVEAQVSDTRAIATFELAIDSRGDTHATWTAVDGHYSVWYANESSGWTDIRVDHDQDPILFDARFDSAIAVDASDVPHVVWADNRNSPPYGSWKTEIWHASATDGFTNRELVLPDDTSPIVRKDGPQLFIDGTGEFHVAFMGDTEGPPYGQTTNLYYANSTDWDRAIQITNLSTTYPGWSVYLPHAVGIRGGTPVLAYRDNRRGDSTLWRTEPWDFGPDVTPPTISGMPDRIVDLPSTLLVGAWGAWDNDRIVSYEWDFVGPATIHRSGSQAAFNFSLVGTYGGRLTVRDPAGLSATASFNVTVRSLSTRSWVTGKPLQTLTISYDHLHFQPLSDGTFALVFQDAYSIVDGAGRFRMGPVRLPYGVVRETYLIDPTGDLHAVGFRNPGLEYSKMRSDGSDVVHAKALATGGLLPQQPTLAFAGGRLWLSWMDQRDGLMEIYLAALNAIGDVTWGPTRISNDTRGSMDPTLLPQGDRLWIVWWDGTDRGWSASASVLNVSTMAFEFQEVRLADGYPTSVAPLPDGGIAFTTTRSSKDGWDVYANRANASGAPTTAPVAVSFVDGASSSGASCAVDTSGTVHVAWQDGSNGTWTRVARVSGTGVVDPVGGLVLRSAQGTYPTSIALALGRDGEPRIAYSQGPDAAPRLLFAYHDPIPPQAVLVAPATALVGAVVTLRATGSTDNDEIVDYHWAFSDGTTTDNGSVVSHRFMRGGTFVVRLDVTDEAGNVGSAQASIAVADAIPTARITGPRAVDEDAVVHFSSVGSTDDGGIVAYDWTISGPWTGSRTGPFLDIAFPEPGEYKVRLTVTDTGGNTNETSLRLTVRDLLEPWVVPSIIWTAILTPELVTGVVLARHWKRRAKELWGDGGGP